VQSPAAKMDGFGQRRTLIGQMWLVPDQHQPTAKTLPAQGVDGLGPSLPAAENRNRGDHHSDATAPVRRRDRFWVPALRAE